MEPSEREPSYYEVALTHRQLTVGLVVALTTVVVAFFAGVWIGRGGGAPAPKEKGVEAAETATTTQPEQLTFFGDKGASSRPPSKPAPIAPKPAAGAPPVASATPASSPAESEAETLRKTLEAEMAANRVDGGDASATPAAAPVAPGARVTRESSTAKAPATTASAPTAKAATPAAPSTSTSKPPAAAPSSAAAGGALWIQVYSSTNRERAIEIASRLKKSSFPVKTLEPTKSGGPYRVRVGPFSDRTKADRSASRLRREFKLDTWVTDTP